MLKFYITIICQNTKVDFPINYKFRCYIGLRHSCKLLSVETGSLSVSRVRHCSNASSGDGILDELPPDFVDTTLESNISKLPANNTISRHYDLESHEKVKCGMDTGPHEVTVNKTHDAIEKSLNGSNEDQMAAIEQQNIEVDIFKAEDQKFDY